MGQGERERVPLTVERGVGPGARVRRWPGPARGGPGGPGEWPAPQRTLHGRERPEM